MGLTDAPLKVDLVYNHIVNFALQQNHVPVIRKLSIKNISETELRNVSIEIASEPEFTLAWNKRIDSLPINELIDIGAVDIKSITQYLAELTERITGNLTLTIKSESDILFKENYNIKILAYDQWNGVGVLPEMLSAFVTPNHPDIAKIIIRASSILDKWTGRPSFDSYQTRNPDRVKKQMGAIYEAIAEMNLVYCTVPASFEESGQRIRMCDTIFKQRMANCLDISLLYASCLEAVGIHPLIIVIKGHAFVGGWLIDESFPDSVNDDVSLLSKRIATGIDEIVLLEGTCMNAGANSVFDAAVQDANYKLLKEDDFILFIDVRRTRFSGIRPLPLRIQTVDGWEILEQQSVDRNTDIPEEIVPTTKLVDVSKIDVTKKQLWERKLLDLTLRNNLLSLRITKSTVQLIFTKLHKLEDALAEGNEFQLLPKPIDWDNSLRNAGVYQSLNLADPVSTLIDHEFTQKRLRSYLSENELNASLTHLYRSSRLSIEENGANTLYISLGMLKWFETPGSERARFSPILLMPVEIIRKSAQKGFVIRTREEETMMNITLLEMLRQDFGINIGGLENLPKDERGVDLKMVFNIIRQGIMTKSRWDVEEQVFLGTFSFSKFIMWNDLQKNSEKLSQNKIVSSLISGKIEWDAAQNPGDAFNFDEKYHPSTIVLPISADSSQLESIAESTTDKSFVLHGPPGTGKSQTITNIISNALYNGKKVLFVAEKMAALSVVRDRLEKIGVGPFCLELHSNKSKKSSVLEHLKRTTGILRTNPPENYRTEAERLFSLRNELNGYVNALHRKYPFGFSVFECFSVDAQLQSISAEIKFSSSILEKLSRTDITGWNDLAEELQVAGSLLPKPNNHPLQLINIKTYSQQLKADSKELINKYLLILKEYRATCNSIIAKQKIDVPVITRAQLDSLNAVFRLILSLPDTPSTLFNLENVEQNLNQVKEIAERGIIRDKLRSDLKIKFQNAILNFDADQNLLEWNNASTKWFLPKYFKHRAIQSSLRKLSQVNKINAEDVVTVLEKIRAYQHEQKLIDAKAGYISPMLGFMWQEGDCNWAQVILIANSVIHINREIISVTGSANKAKLWRENLAQELSEGSKNFLSVQGALLQKFVDLHLRLSSAQREISETLQIDFSNIKLVSENYLDALEESLNKIFENIDGLKDWVSWLNAKEAAAKAGLTPLIVAYEAGQIESLSLVHAYKKGLYRSCAEYIIGKEPALSLFNGKLFEEKIRRFREMSQYFEKLTKEELYAKLAARIPDFTKEASQSSEIGLLQRTIRNNGRAMPIRKLFDAIPNLLPRIVPCMLMSPISVAQYFDAGGPKFDLVVFDEASQMPTCEAVGAIARANNMIIVGDPKQLPPTSFFSTNNIDEENIEKEDLESILDDCLALSMPSKHLLWHYRSKHESLIAFSNSNYYENKLLTFPSPDDIASKVIYISVAGYYDRGKTRQNSFEAKAVIDEIKRRLSDPILAKKSIGVVTFSSVQQILIQNLFDELLRSNPQLESIALDCSEPIFIKNLENVQGDERDVILFSVGYGPDVEGKVSLNFGPLNREGGWRRLNVAVSRARYEMKVFSTLRADQIDVTRSASEGVAGVKAFLEYAEKGRSTLNIKNTGPKISESGFEKLIADEIRKNGYEVHTNIGCSGYRIDMGIVSKEKPSEYILGIICDGNNYNAAKTAKDREITQHDVLKLLGWSIHKIWSTDWWENADNVLNDVLKAIQAAESNKEEIIAEPHQAIIHPDPAQTLNTNNAEIHPLTITPRTNTEYIICDLGIVRSTSSDDFLQYSNTHKIKEQIRSVIEIESPIKRDLLARRVLASWGISKLGTRINARLEQLLADMNLVKTGSANDAVFWSENLKTNEYKTYRIATATGLKRDADDLPPEEIANAIREVLSNQISLPIDELVREMSRVFGFARSGTNVETAMKKGISKAIALGYVLEKDGRIIHREI